MEKLFTKIDEKIHLHDSQNLSFGTLSELSDFWGKNNQKKSLTSKQTLSTKNLDYSFNNEKNQLYENNNDSKNDNKMNISQQDEFSFLPRFDSMHQSQNSSFSSAKVFNNFLAPSNKNTQQKHVSAPNQKYSILICTDFAFPKFGGVETHGYQLGQCLIERGHKVTFLTNNFQSSRTGVRHMANGMKIYHLPQLPVMSGDVAFLSFFSSLPIIRQILIREQIDIVHGHQSTSILQHIVLMAAKSMGLKTVFTEHSLFSYNDLFGIHLNKLIKWSFRDLDAAICVSHACKDNFVLRAKLDPKKTFTIPNAVDSDKFTPNVALRDKEIAMSGNPDQINIVFISRLAYRKGVDLLIGIIPKILAQFQNVHFIIGGDGEGMINLQKLVEKHNLHGRVELLGGLPHDKVKDVLNRGHIFLNTSLTESFCIAILEAACCGLLVVSTDVGGVPEVLPPHMAYLAKPDEKSILKQLRRAVQNVKKIPCEKFYSEVANIYSWRQVAERTEKVYDYVAAQYAPNMLVRIKSGLSWGQIVGFWAIFFTILEAIVMFFVDIFLPVGDIDIVQNFSQKNYNANNKQFGNHKFSVKSLQDVRNSEFLLKPRIIDQYEFEYPIESIEQNLKPKIYNRYKIIQPQDEQLNQYYYEQQQKKCLSYNPNKKLKKSMIHQQRDEEDLNQSLNESCFSGNKKLTNFSIPFSSENDSESEHNQTCYCSSSTDQVMKLFEKKSNKKLKKQSIRLIHTQRKHQRRIEKNLYCIDCPGKVNMKGLVYGGEEGVQIYLSYKQLHKHFKLHCVNSERLKMMKNAKKVKEEEQSVNEAALSQSSIIARLNFVKSDDPKLNKEQDELSSPSIDQCEMTDTLASINNHCFIEKLNSKQSSISPFSQANTADTFTLNTQDSKYNLNKSLHEKQFNKIDEQAKEKNIHKYNQVVQVPEKPIRQFKIEKSDHIQSPSWYKSFLNEIQQSDSINSSLMTLKKRSSSQNKSEQLKNEKINQNCQEPKQKIQLISSIEDKITY